MGKSTGLCQAHPDSIAVGVATDASQGSTLTDLHHFLGHHPRGLLQASTTSGHTSHVLNMCSLVLDYRARVKSGCTHVTYG